jgi:hypothetical protein
MGLMNFVNLLQSYTGASASAPPANAKQDFAKVADSVPQPHLASGLATAFRSNETPPLPDNARAGATGSGIGGATVSPARPEQ